MSKSDGVLGVRYSPGSTSLKFSGVWGPLGPSTIVNLTVKQYRYGILSNIDRNTGSGV